MDVMILHAKTGENFVLSCGKNIMQKLLFLWNVQWRSVSYKNVFGILWLHLRPVCSQWKTISFVVGYLCVWGRKRVRDSYQNSQHRNCFEKASRVSTQTTIWSWTQKSTHDTKPWCSKGVRNFLPGFPIACTISSQVWFWHLLCPYINLVGWYRMNLLLSNLVNFLVHIFFFSHSLATFLFVWILWFFDI